MLSWTGPHVVGLQEHSFFYQYLSTQKEGSSMAITMRFEVQTKMAKIHEAKDGSRATMCKVLLLQPRMIGALWLWLYK